MLRQEYGVIARRVFIHSVDSESSVHIQYLREQLKILKKQLRMSLTRDGTKVYALEEEIASLTSLITRERMIEDDAYDVEREYLDYLENRLKSSTKALEKLKESEFWMCHCLAACNIFEQRIERSVSRLEIEKQYTIYDGNSTTAEKNMLTEQQRKLASTDLNNKRKSRHRDRNRHTFVIGEDSSLSFFSRKRRLEDAAFLDPEEKSEMSLKIRRKIIDLNNRRNKHFPWSSGKEILRNAHSKHSESKAIENLHQYLECWNNRQRARTTVKEYACNTLIFQKYFNKHVSIDSYTDFLSEKYQLASMQRPNYTFLNGLKFKADPIKLADDIGISIMVDFLYPLCASTKKAEYSLKFAKLANLQFSVQSCPDVYPKYLQGKMVSSLEFHKFWLFNNFNFIEQLQKNHYFPFHRTSDLLKKLDVDATQKIGLSELRFSIKVINFNDVDILSPTVKKYHKKVPFFDHNHKLKSKYLLPDNWDYQKVLKKLLVDEEVLDAQFSDFLALRKLLKWGELEPFAELNSLPDLLSVMSCTGCLEFIQENFIFTEWSLVDIDEKLSKYSILCQDLLFNEEKYFSEAIFYDNANLKKESKLDFTDLGPTGPINKEKFIEVMSQIKLLVLINKNTNEIQVIKYKHFSFNTILSHLMEEYTSVLEKITCVPEKQIFVSSFECC